MQPGDRDALLRLGQLYIHGIEGAPLDKKEGYRFILEAANLDSPEAQYLLGKAYESGSGVKKDAEQAVRWLRKSAAQHHAGAQNELGLLYIQGEGVERNEHAAFKHWKASAMQNHPLAQYNLVGLYMQGLGVEKITRKRPNGSSQVRSKANRKLCSFWDSYT